MKNIKLKPGFLVDNWDGGIQLVDYCLIDYIWYGNLEKRFLYVDKEGNFSEPISKYNSTKIFDTPEEAEKHSAIKKQERSKYYENQIKEYSEKLEEYKSS